MKSDLTYKNFSYSIENLIMKKDRALITPLMVVILITTMIISGCGSVNDNVAKERLFYDVASEKVFNLNNQAHLNELAILLAKEPTEIKISKDAYVTELTDSKGTFNAISVNYQTGGVTTKMIVPLSKVSPDKIEVKAEDCVMKFILKSGLSTCTEEIIERCKTQKCICADGGECTSSIAFND